MFLTLITMLVLIRMVWLAMSLGLWWLAISSQPIRLLDLAPPHTAAALIKYLLHRHSGFLADLVRLGNLAETVPAIAEPVHNIFIFYAEFGCQLIAYRMV